MRAMNDVGRLTDFVSGMGYKLAKNSHKTDWRDDSVSIDQFVEQLRQEMKELESALLAEDCSVDDVMDECWDVANQAFILCDKVKYLSEKEDA